MEAINLFFTQNRPLIYFIGGLSFFSMGLASALQRRRYSRLRLAQWLDLLVWFGILYGLNEWGNLFIPLQEALPVPETASWMAVLQLAVRGLALALLFQFGVELLRPPARAARHAWVGAAAQCRTGRAAPAPGPAQPAGPQPARKRWPEPEAPPARG